MNVDQRELARLGALTEAAGALAESWVNGNKSAVVADLLETQNDWGAGGGLALVALVAHALAGLTDPAASQGEEVAALVLALVRRGDG